MKSSTFTPPTSSSKRVRTRRIVKEALVELEQLRQEMWESQRRSDEIEKRTDLTLAHIKRKLGME